MRRVVALMLVAGTAAAEPADLDGAQKAIDDIDYETASGLVSEALAEGKLPVGELARAHRLAGEIAAALDDAAGAREHFLIWIMLEPDAALPSGASPKLTEPFNDARVKSQGMGGMSVDVHAERVDGGVRIILDARDPLNLIAGLRAEGGGQVASERGTSVELPAGDDAVTLDVTIVDDHDNEIAVKTVTVSPKGVMAVTRTVTKGGWPFIVRWPTWTVLAAGALGTGGYFAWQVQKDQDELAALNADSENHTFDEALAVEEKGKRHALYADVAFGVGGALAVVAILALVLEPDERVEIEPVMTGDGAGATATLRF